MKQCVESNKRIFIFLEIYQAQFNEIWPAEVLCLAAAQFNLSSTHCSTLKTADSHCLSTPHLPPPPHISIEYVSQSYIAYVAAEQTV